MDFSGKTTPTKLLFVGGEGHSSSRPSHFPKLLASGLAPRSTQREASNLVGCNTSVVLGGRGLLHPGLLLTPHRQASVCRCCSSSSLAFPPPFIALLTTGWTFLTIPISLNLSGPIGIPRLPHSQPDPFPSLLSWLPSSLVPFQGTRGSPWISH